MSEEKKPDFKIQNILIGLIPRTVTLTLAAKGGGSVQVVNVPFDPPGDQRESEMEEAAKAAAKRVLRAAADAL